MVDGIGGGNMRIQKWQVAFGTILIVVSVLLYSLHFLVFRDAHHIWIYLLGDIAFIPLEVLVVTMIIHQLLVRREKEAMLDKLNMVIAVFFSETGNELLRRLTEFSGRADELRAALKPIPGKVAMRDLRAALRVVLETDPAVDCGRGDLKGLRDFLLSKRECLMRLIGNPNLMEHEAFTDVLWGVVHLEEELAARDLSTAPSLPDAKHLAGDMRRAYERTVVSWVAYMEHLETAYPYLFSLAVRQNPFVPHASVVVRE